MNGIAVALLATSGKVENRGPQFVCFTYYSNLLQQRRKTKK